MPEIGIIKDCAECLDFVKLFLGIITSNFTVLETIDSES